MFGIGAPELLILLGGGVLLAGVVLAIVLPARMASKRRTSAGSGWVQCPACGVTLSADHRFCGACGTHFFQGKP